MTFKGTPSRTQNSLELEVENIGAKINAYTSRETTCFQAQSFDKDVPKMIEILSDIVQKSNIDQGAVQREKDVILREMEEVNKDTTELLFDQLHAVAFQG
jgi:processing peptidase subunit beta